MSDDRGMYVPPKVLRVLEEGEQLDFAANGHEIRAAWDVRMVHQQTVLVTDRRLLLVGQPSLFGKVAPVGLAVPWGACRGVTGETDGGWVRIDLQTTDGVLEICMTASNAYEVETRSRRHIVRTRDGLSR